MIARVRGVIVSASCRASNENASSSASTRTGRAPQRRIAATVAWKVLACVTTSSPSVTPQARSAMISASVPVFTPPRVPGAHESGEVRLERLDLGGQDVAAREQHVADLGHEGARIVAELLTVVVARDLCRHHVTP
jgi:hypothetical protein